jgi:ribosomal protein S14
MECFTNMLPKEEKTPQKMAPGAQVRSDFPVPQGAVGVIIGKKGETITNLQGDTVTRIQFKPEEAGSQIRGCYITGSMDGVYRAQQIVMGICRKKMTGIDTLQNFGEIFFMSHSKLFYRKNCYKFQIRGMSILLRNRSKVPDFLLLSYLSKRTF